MLEWQPLLDQIHGCHNCRLTDGRTQAVPGEGNPNADILLVGEGPGAQEDLQGRPFVGPAGKLLDKMLEAIYLSREQVYIANVVKCRPPDNRIPLADEVQACLPYLRNQTALIRPRIIVCFGATAGQALIDPQLRITRERGIWIERKGFWLIATYHPAALLRDVSKKSEAWQDLQAIRDKLEAIRRDSR